MVLDRVPDDLAIALLEYLRVRDLGSCCGVWRELSARDDVWTALARPLLGARPGGEPNFRMHFFLCGAWTGRRVPALAVGVLANFGSGPRLEGSVPAARRRAERGRVVAAKKAGPRLRAEPPLGQGGVRAPLRAAPVQRGRGAGALRRARSRRGNAFANSFERERVR